MSRSTRLGLALISAGTALGVLADLLRATPLGVNALVWLGAFVGVAAALLGWQRTSLDGGRVWLAIPVLVFGALFAWRDSQWLATLNLFAAATSLALAGTAALRIWVAGVTEYVRAALAAAWAALVGAAVTLVGDVSWAELPRGARARQLGAVGRGLALGAPLVVVFGGLFAAADAVFEDVVQALVPSDVGTPAVHLVAVSAAAWPTIGLLRRIFVPADEAAPFEERRGRRFTLGSLELAVAVGLLDLLFLAFVLIQLRYLFGGDERVVSQTGLTYAEYARQGFFELVVVAALALPVLLAADWALARDARRTWVFRLLAALLVVLLFVVMASALQRMRLYQRAYGLTELRVYATAFMLWLAAVVAWTGVTVLRGRRERFAFGALVAGFATILVLNAVNPDALIARTNVDRARTGADVDLRYLGGLSDDAVPALVAALPSLDEDVRGQLARNLLARGGRDDWRTWNWSRSRADALVAERRSELLRAR